MQEIDYDKIMSDRKLFNEFVYTPLSEALIILEERRKDKELAKKIEELLKGDIPECFSGYKKYAVHFRQIATPNYDAEFFLSITNHKDIQPVFFEYPEDKFTSNNDFKHSLGQLRIHDGVNKHGDYKSQKITIVDFAKQDGHKLKDIKTMWGESLHEFHRKLFDAYNIKQDEIVFYNISEWLKKHGGDPDNYYKELLALFVKDAILFENFLMTGEEGGFSKKVVLPAIEYIKNNFSVKPLIVPIPPMEIEEDEHWISYNSKIKHLIK